MAMVQFDYDSIRNDLMNSLQKRLDGRILPNSTAMHLIDIFAEKFSQIAAYNEYLTRENKWSLAQNTSSILTQLELFGYTPHRKKGASGYVQVSADPNFSSTYQYNILIPKFTRFSNGSLVYCSTEDVVLTSTDKYVSVPVIQGELRTTGEFLGNSFPGDVYTIQDPNVENSLYELRNNNIICTEVSWFGETQVSINGSLPNTYTYNNFEYRIKNLPDFSGIQIEFAPNSHDVNDHFEFRYLVTEGEDGSCFEYATEQSPNQGITRVVSSVVDSQGTSVKLYVRNTSGISGGTDYETINEIRDNAPYTFNRVDKIITYNDYVAAIREIEPDGIFEIWTDARMRYKDLVRETEDSSSFILSSKVFFTGVRYSTADRTVSPIGSEALYDEIVKKLSDRSSLTDYFLPREPEIFRFYINGKVYYDMNKTNVTNLQKDVADRILEEYNAKNAAFNRSIYRSNYTALFSGISGIDHVDVNVVMYTEITFDTKGSTITTGSREHFDFPLAISSETALSGQYVFTSANLPSKTSPADYLLVKDLFILKKEDDIWTFYTPDGMTPLSGTSGDGTIIWTETSTSDLDDKKILDSFVIHTTTSFGTAIGSALDGKAMVCRFVPENFNCVVEEEEQIIIYSDSKGDDMSGVLDPWKRGEHGGAEYRGGENWWYNQSDPCRYGVGLVFEGK